MCQVRLLIPFVALMALLLVPPLTLAEPPTISIVRIPLHGPEQLRALAALKVDVSRVERDFCEAYLDRQKLAEVEDAGFAVTVLYADEREYGAELRRQGRYPAYEETIARLEALAASYPDIVRLFDAGTSMQGRRLTVVEISDQPNVHEFEPAGRGPGGRAGESGCAHGSGMASRCGVSLHRTGPGGGGCRQGRLRQRAGEETP